MAEHRGYRGEREDFETDDLRYRRGYGEDRQQQGERFSRGWQGGDMGGGRGYGESNWAQQGSRDYGGRDRGGREFREYRSQQSGFDRGGAPQYGGGYGQSGTSQSGFGETGPDDWSATSRFGDEHRGGYGAGMGPRGGFGYERGSSGDRGYGDRGYGGGYGDRGYGGGYGARGSYDRDYGSHRGGGSNWTGRSYGGERDDRGFWDKASDEVSSWFGDEDAERRRRMDQFRGRGPKNYMRSDERIKEDVNDRLSDDGNLDASDIEVDVSQGEVTLSGHISNRWDKRRAEDIAESVSGVKHVQNNLRVRTSEVGNAVTGGLTAATGATSTSSSGKRSNM